MILTFTTPTGWLEGQLVGLFSDRYDRQLSEDEMGQIRGLIFSFMPELRSTLLETTQTIRKFVLKNRGKLFNNVEYFLVPL